MELGGGWEEGNVNGVGRESGGGSVDAERGKGIGRGVGREEW